MKSLDKFLEYDMMVIVKCMEKIYYDEKNACRFD